MRGGRRTGLLLAALTFALTLGVAVAQAGKVAEATFGGKGTTGGLFEGPGDVAVDQATGQVYVSDETNRRIQRFDSDGDFELTFGRDVIEEGAPGDLGDVFEVCTVAPDCKAGAGGAKGALTDHRPGEIGSSEAALAIDQTSGDLYLLDGHNRIVKFNVDGNGTPAEPADDLPVFDRAWGWDVVEPGGAGQVLGDEVQEVIIGDPLIAEGGTFELGFRGADTEGEFKFTAAIAHDASAAAVQAALEGLSTLAPGDVTVSGAAGGPWTVEFGGAYAGLNLSQMNIDGDALVGSPVNSGAVSRRITTKADGAGFEVCVIASQCQRGTVGFDAGHVAGLSLAVSPLDGDVFLANTFLARVEQFEADGDLVRAWGWGVDTGAAQFEICTAESGCQVAVPPPLRPESTTLTEIPETGQFNANVIEGGIFQAGNQPAEITVDSAGVVYASNGGDLTFAQDNEFISASRVERFDSTAVEPAGLSLDPIGNVNPPPEFAAGPLPRGPVRGLEVDSGNDHLYYLSALGGGVVEIDATTVPFDPVLVDTHMQGVDPEVDPVGLGYDNLTDRLFVSIGNVDHVPYYRMVVLGETGSPPPTLVVNPPAGVGSHQVTLTGEVTPNGPPSIETSYRFEYRKVGATVWLQVPSTPVNLGDGNSPVPVEQGISSLEACDDYEVRLFAAKSFGGGTTISPPQVFETSCVAPELQALPPQRVTDTEATLAGNLNANNLATTYRFEYLTEAEFQANGYANAISVPVPDGEANGGSFAKVVEDIGGLEPSTAYRYRLVATNAQGTTVGEDATFTTKATPASPAPERGYEMVTPPFKVVRAAVWPSNDPGNNPNVGIASLAGETIVWKVPYFPLTDEVGSPGDGDKRMLRRHPQLGWVNETLNTLKIASGDPILVGQGILAASADLETQPVDVEGGQELPQTGGLLPTEGNVANRFYTFRKGTGIEGYTPWLTNPEEQWDTSEDINYKQLGEALVDDAGTAMVRWAPFRGVGEDPGTPGDDDPSDDETVSGTMAYLQRAADPDELPAAPKHLVSACTGSGATATLVPSLTGSETITTRECPTKTSTDMTSALGAMVGGAGVGDTVFKGPRATALSEGGHRVFFSSPDPNNGKTPKLLCKPGATGSFTSCPPQLYVRQYDSGGNATVRWISRSQGIVGAQKAAEIGAGAVFEGASREGRYVYFKTNSPLLPTDPNGGVSITTGSASDDSWDLYRYELPESLDEDPANGTLTRISGGLEGTADPSTNQVAFGTSPAGAGTPLRFLSDDGKRAYFLTTSPIAGADETAPEGGSTSPGGTVGNTETRNLYLFDDTAEGAGRYRFIAQIPYVLGSSDTIEKLNACASSASRLDPQIGSQGAADIDLEPTNCFRGTPDGSHVVFFTGAQLSSDDNDEAGDIYLYDVAADELSRVSAPAAGAAPYVCESADGIGNPTDALCNADLGWITVPVAAGGGGLPELETARGWAGGRYYNISRGKDGEVSVFFESRSELVAADTNGTHWDVYEWRAGKLRLLSPGDSADHSYFSGNSLDGEDVFIWTSKRIDPREIDAADYDLYDARIGGGFPYTPPPIPCDVLALECEDEALPAPPTRAPDSAGFQGSGNVIEKPRKPRCRKGQVRRKGRCVAKRKARKARKAKGRR